MKILNNQRESAEISLCNLGSINLKIFNKLNDLEQQKVCNCIVRALDNTIDIAYYPVEDAKVTNEEYRYIGVGVLNLANDLASNKIVIDSKEAQEYIDKTFDNLSYKVYNASLNLAKERGPAPGFKNTKWAEGVTPVHLSMKYFPDVWNLTDYKVNKDKWDKLGQEIKEFGLRNCQVMAIAPTSSSGKAINCTESTEPIPEFYYKDEGVTNVFTLAPNIQENASYYKPAFECDQDNLIINAAIRQKYLDQAQSVTLYFKQMNSLKELTDIHIKGFKMGLKTYYYLKQQKANLKEIDVCEACTL